MKCRVCGQGYELSIKDEELYSQFGFPHDRLCFDCNQKQKISFRNGRNFYQRNCDATGRRIISAYSPDKPYKIYKSDAWYGDSWDGLQFGMDYDPALPFFEQYKSLQRAVPRIALLNVKAENSEYCNMTYGNKNCYMVFGGDFNEDTLYGTLCMHNKNCVDCDFSNSNELCYEICDCVDCYDCRFALDSKNCSGCAFISNCTGCKNCILCVNLVQKSYCVRNRQLSKDEYEDIRVQLLNGSRACQKRGGEEFLRIREQRIVKNSEMISCETCTGGYLKYSRNCTNAYDVSDSEDVHDTIFASRSKDCFRSALLGDGSELCFNMMSTIRALDSACCFFTIDSSAILYSEMILNSCDIFGSISLRKKQYCILNKQYTEEEYNKTKQKIVRSMQERGEWGCFLPQELSCFAYNESTVNDYYPLSPEQAREQGFAWREDEQREYKPQTALVPDCVSEVSESITKEILLCANCRKNYRIAGPEFRFYQRQGIALPGECFNCRHLRRLKMRAPRKLHRRSCACCAVPVMSTYAPERKEVLYCESCYQRAVY